jgi:hypothetical protein
MAAARTAPVGGTTPGQASKSAGACQASFRTDFRKGNRRRVRNVDEGNPFSMTTTP